MFVPIGEWFGKNIGITSGVIGIEFVVGLVLGLLIKKAIKLIIITAIVIGIGSYLGIIAGNSSSLSQYEMAAISVTSLLLSVAPLSAGIVIGLIIGFIKG